MTKTSARYDRDLQEKLGRLIARLLSPTVSTPLDQRMQELLDALDGKTRRYG